MEILQGIDLGQIGFTGLVVVGAVNAATMWKKDLTSQQKLALAVAIAFVAGFVPADLGNLIANKVKDALVVALGSSGSYKLLSKAGGN